jgi:hypothetical protein
MREMAEQRRAFAAARSSDVALDHSGWSNMCLRRVAARLPQRAPLPQQIPALVELDLQLRQSLAVIRGGITPLQQLVFFGYQALDVPEHRRILVDLLHEGLPDDVARTDPPDRLFAPTRRLAMAML